MTTTMARAGLFSRMRAGLFGERDRVAEQLADIARQGTGMARLAHFAAAIMLVLFSLASLIALGADVLQESVASIKAGNPNIPAIVSLSVTALLVPCMDLAMLYGASKIRLLATRRADAKEMRLHKWIIGAVAVIEAATYAYMVWRFEAPAGVIAWGLVGARGLAAPLLSVYLSMARAIPVQARDILSQVELASGMGLIKDAVTIANDPHATLEQKARLFGASAVMSEQDATRLAGLLGAVTQAHPVSVREVAPRPPTGGGSPTAIRRGSATPDGMPANVTAISTAQTPARARGGSGPRRKRRAGIAASVEPQARRAWQPGMSIEGLRDAAGISQASAQKYHARFTAEAGQQEGFAQ